jgi:hypothetical protein
MRMSILGIAVVLVLAVGCQSVGQAPQLTKQEALSRCGGISPGSGAIVAGTDNEYFTASSRQSIKIKPGIEIKTAAGADSMATADQAGKGHALTLIGRDNASVNLDCRCPAGCGESGDGCAYIVVIGSRDAFCVGDCENPTGCCFGCGWH